MTDPRTGCLATFEPCLGENCHNGHTDCWSEKPHKKCAGTGFVLVPDRAIPAIAIDGALAILDRERERWLKGKHGDGALRVLDAIRSTITDGAKT